jgi:hypothetical protein
MRRLTFLVLVGLAVPCFADAKEELFGNGKAPNFREEPMDRKFAKSKFAKMLKTGTDEPACVQLLGGLFVALAEVAPHLHKRDENFSLDPTLVEAVNTQLTTPNFPAMAYLVSMVRRVMIDHRLSDEWLELATNLNKVVKIIDVAKLKQLNEGVSLVDSAYYTIPLMRERYVVEALNSNSAVTTDVIQTFKDTYLDRDVAWGGATLIDVGINQPKGRRKARYKDAEPEELVAVLQWYPPDPRKIELDLLAKAPVKVDPVTIYARLEAKQYTDIEKLYKNQRVLVKGRFWSMTRDGNTIELRNTHIFTDPDWAQGTVLANPAEIADCSVAINELTGLSPVQPGGFHH